MGNTTREKIQRQTDTDRPTHRERQRETKGAEVLALTQNRNREGGAGWAEEGHQALSRTYCVTRT